MGDLGLWSEETVSDLYFRSSRSHNSDDVPTYDLPPPKFSLKGLMIVLENWKCVKAALMSEGTSEEGAGPTKGQSSTVSLDAFTHLLLTKLNPKVCHTRYWSPVVVAGLIYSP
jgi:hypothetical protein